MVNNVIKNSASFDMFFNFHLKISNFKKIYFKTFYKFINFSELASYQEDKVLIKSPIVIIYNPLKIKFQIIAQYRPPIVIILILAFYLLFFFLEYFNIKI